MTHGMDLQGRNAARELEYRSRHSGHDVAHIPSVTPRGKMDTPVGLFGGACSCGWASEGLETENGGYKSAVQHADARNGFV